MGGLGGVAGVVGACQGRLVLGTCNSQWRQNFIQNKFRASYPVNPVYNKTAHFHRVSSPSRPARKHCSQQQQQQARLAGQPTEAELARGRRAMARSSSLHRAAVEALVHAGPLDPLRVGQLALLGRQRCNGRRDGWQGCNNDGVCGSGCQY